MKIRRLSNDLANQFAAGEVVERPASVVKELVENSVDANATRVRVEIVQGGLALVQVSDDGEGMARDDALLCLERHATSKIARAEDLFSLRTFGFRGEAVPSIASVSRFTMVTRTREDPEATQLDVEGGGDAKVRPAGANVGTTITVADLFFNVPARRKFLKSTGTEGAHVGEVVLLAALACPLVTFTLARDGRVAREYLRATSREDRVRQALSAERLVRAIGTRGPLTIEALLAAPERARAGASGLHLFVNGRPVRDRSLARAVAQSYGSVLEGGRYPIGVVYLDLAPELVDINVHPQKAEVRFQDARALFDAIVRELHGQLAAAFALPSVGPPSYAPAFNSGARPFPDAPAAWTPSLASSSEELPLSEGYSLPQAGLFEKTRGFYANLAFLAQLRGTFLLCEGEDGLYILDQHAAAERVTFHRLREAYRSRSLAMQRLLVPEVLELTADQVAAFEENAERVVSLGLEVRAAGPTAVAVHAVPTLLARATPRELVTDLAAELSRDATRPFEGAVDLVLATMACHGSVRAGDAVGEEEARALLHALDEVDFAGHCPHGRPIVSRLPFSELERRVGR